MLNKLVTGQVALTELGGPPMIFYAAVSEAVPRLDIAVDLPHDVER